MLSGPWDLVGAGAGPAGLCGTRGRPSGELADLNGPAAPREVALTWLPSAMGSALRRRCEGLGATGGRSIKYILGLALAPAEQIETRHWETALAQESDGIFVDRRPGQERGKGKGIR